MTPLIGVNYNCHGNFWVSTNESIARAVRQVQHVVGRGFTGGLWYIGNEDNAQDHAELIAAHARAMKAVDSTIRVFWNDNSLSPALLKRFLSTAGSVVDGAEFHGKWPFGGAPGLHPGTYQEWLKEVPLMERKSGQTWRAKIKELRAAAAEMGRPGLLLANNEYGLGKPSSLKGFNRFTKGLVVVEFAMEMYVAGYDVAAFWDNSDGGSASHGDQMLLSSAHGWRFNPMHIGLELLAESAGLQMLNMSRPTFTNRNIHVDRVHGFAALDPSSHRLRVYLINKMEHTMRVRLRLPAQWSADAKGDVVFSAASMVDTADHWGTKSSLLVACGGGACVAELPGASFTRLASAAG